jgi:hypothetical protein
VVIEFCVDFIDDLTVIWVPEWRYEGRIRGKGTLGKKAYACMYDFSFRKAHYMVFQQSSLVDLYIEEHRRFYALNSQNSLGPGFHVDTWILSPVGCGSI